MYVEQPHGYAQGDGRLVCKLKKALYGLRQAPRAWFLTLKSKLEAMGLVACESDPCLYVRRHEDGSITAVAAWVDDMLIAAPNLSCVDDVKQHLASEFKFRDLGEASYFIGMELTRDRAARTLHISQRQYVIDMLQRFSMQDANAVDVPMAADTKLHKAADGEEPLDTTRYPYRELIGTLLFLSVCTSPDIACVVNKLTRYMSVPTIKHWEAAKKLLRYVGGTKDLGLTYGGGMEEPLGYCDADHNGDTDTLRSTTGFVFLYNGAAISWMSRLQPTVAKSTLEAEYMAVNSAACEAVWLAKLFGYVGIKVGTCKMYGDNQGALAAIRNPCASPKTKHIATMHHFARERLYRGEISYEYVETKRNVADIYTKPLDKIKFEYCRDNLGLS